MTVKQTDVAIIGGGLAGNLLARQLRLQLPDVSVSMFERDTERTYKVGESTVEIATLYLVKRLGLSTYIYSEHLPKNGLRYFFDSPEKQTALTAMSEIGIDGLPPYPSFQIDRARFEADLLKMNADMQVDVQIGARVKDLKLSEDGGRHTFTVVHAGNETSYAARWVIDASGSAGVIPKLRNLRLPEKRLKNAAAWGRAVGVSDIDSFAGEGSADFHKRANYTSRFLSTNHFMYDGYWLWFIPLRNGITSLGVVCDRSKWDVSRHKKQGFLDFFRTHKAVESLLPNAELLDIDAFTQLAYRTKQFFSEERWATIGNAGAFPDPFYSPGSDFIAVENDITVDLIKRDLAGDGAVKRGESFAEMIDLYNRYMQFRFDATMVIYDGLYSTFGSFELMRAKIFFDTASYYNLLFDSYARDEHLSPRWLRTALRRRDTVLGVMGTFESMFIGLGDEMRKRGTYFRKNTGHAELEGRATFGVMEHVGEARTRRQVNARSEEIFERTRDLVRECLDGDDAAFQTLANASEKRIDAWAALR